MNGLLDTSFFIARDSGRPLDDMDDIAATEISVVTVAELTAGVLAATDETRSSRVATLAAVESTWDPLPISAAVARQFAHTVNELRVAGRRISVLDGLIAATALVHDLALISQDNDFALIPGLTVRLI